MKSNEVPEKIYLIRNISTPTSLNTTNDCHEKYLQEWYKEREKDTDIEYTRTDAFIEKAETYLKEQFVKDVSVLAGSVVHINFKTAINNFINYMKGE